MREDTLAATTPSAYKSSPELQDALTMITCWLYRVYMPYSTARHSQLKNVSLAVEELNYSSHHSQRLEKVLGRQQI